MSPKVLGAQARRINRNVVAPLFHEFVLDNFVNGGRPKFRKNSELTNHFKSNSGVLVGETGELFQKAILNPVIIATETSVILKIRNPSARLKASAWALHNGSIRPIRKTDKMRAFFWAMYYETAETNPGIAEIFKRMAIGKRDFIRYILPARPWTRITLAQRKVIQDAVNKAWSEFLVGRK